MARKSVMSVVARGSPSVEFSAKRQKMQTQNPLLDEVAKLTQAALGLAQSAGEEARSAVRAQADRWAADLDLVRRDEFEALKAELAVLRSRLEALEGNATGA